jgi:hypothetical protein
VVDGKWTAAGGTSGMIAAAIVFSNAAIADNRLGQVFGNGGGGGGAVSSVFGRTGAVSAQTGDYTAAQVTNAAATNAANTFGAFTQTFTNSTLLIPSTAAAAPTANASIAFDSTTHTYQFGSNGSTLAMSYFTGAPPASGNCVQTGASSYQLTSTGAPCGAGGSGITQLTGDVTAGPGTGSQAATLAAVGSSGTCGDTTHSCGITVDTKGRVTAHTNNAITGGTSFQSAGVLASRPATCTAGSGVYQYFATDQPLGQQWYYCGSTPNTWVQSILLGSSALQFTAGALDINLGIIPRITNFSDIAVGWRFKAGMDLLEQSDCASAGTTPSAGNLHFCADPSTDSFYAVTSAGVATKLGGGGSKTWIKASTSAGTIASGSTDVPWNTNDSSNTGSGVTHSTSVNPERFTAATAGYYHGYCSIAGGGFSGSALIVSVIYNNGTDHAVTSPLVGTTTDGGMTAPFSLHMAVGDYVKCNTNSTSSITVTSDATNFVIEN